MTQRLKHDDRKWLLDALADLPQFATVRGRQAIVRNALGGHPLSAEVEKALRWLDWEGPPIEVADQLLHLLNVHEPPLAFRLWR